MTSNFDSTSEKIKIAALYKFTKINNCPEFRKSLQDRCEKLNILGGLIIASEGLNGTISGIPKSIDDIIDFLLSLDGFAGMSVKFSESSTSPFYRLRIRISSEIITMGTEMNEFGGQIGSYVDPYEWNDLIKNPDVVVIDTRNDYEFSLGTFRGAMNPNTTSFTEFPKFVENNIPRTSKIAMFCTGGIRCEKASAYLLSRGYQTVYQLHGGILKYLEEIPQERSLWEGECYVFDQRVSVRHGLEPGTYSLCRACRHVLSENNLKHENFKLGIHCEYCYDKLDEETMRANEERQKQIILAEKRQIPHLGFKERRTVSSSVSTPSLPQSSASSTSSTEDS